MQATTAIPIHLLAVNFKCIAVIMVIKITHVIISIM